MRALGWIVPCVAFGCTEVERFEPFETSRVLFVLDLDETLRPSSSISGPFEATELPARWSIADDHRLLVLSVDREALQARYPSFEPAAWRSLRLVPLPEGLESCHDEGLLEDDARVTVSLARLSGAIETSVLGDRGFEPAPELVPGSLALRFDGAVCNQGAPPIMRPFTDPEDEISLGAWAGIGPPRGMVAIDADTVVVFGTGGLARLRRGLPFDSERDLISFQGLLGDVSAGRANNPTAILERDSARAVTTLAVVTSVLTQPEETLVLARFALFDAGGFELLSTGEIGRQPSFERWLGDLLVEPDGSLVGAGGRWVFTATPAATRPRVSTALVGFEGSRVLASMEERSPHVVLSTKTVFEGSLTSGITNPASLTTYGPVEVGEALSGDYMIDADRTPLAGFDDGRLRSRRARGDWVEYPFRLPKEAAPCAGALRVCGRRANLETPYGLLAAPGLGGHVIATGYCSAFFFRSARDSCASSFARGPYERGDQARNSIVAMTEFEGRVFIVTSDRRVHELALE